MWKWLVLVLAVGLVAGEVAAQTVSLSVLGDGTAAEVDQSTATFRFSRTGSTAATLQVFLDEGGTAVRDVDYNQSGLIGTAPLSINIPAGQSFFDYVITPRMDVLSEPTETVTITLRDDVGTYDVDPGSVDPVSIDILDDPPIVSLAVLDGTADEVTQDTASFRFSRVGGNLNQALQVFLDEGGTAVRDTDYTQSGLIGTAPLSISIPAGAASFDYVITPKMDVLSESTETVTVTIREDFGTYETDPGSLNVVYSVDILDDPPIVSLAVLDDTAEEVTQDTASFRFSRVGGNISQPLQVFLDEGGTAVRDADYTQSGLIGTAPLSINIPAGASSFDYVITPRMDVLSEPTETVTVTIREDFGTYDTDPGSLDVVYSIDILDDPPIVSLAVLDDTAEEVTQDTASFRFSRVGGNINQALRVFLDEGGTAVRDVDYNQVGLIGTAPLSINIPAGASSFDYVITPRMDVLSEPTETVTVTIREDFGTYDTDPGSLDVVYSIDILDDPPIVSLAVLDGTADEVTQDTATFRFSRVGGNINQALQVFLDEGGTAVRDVDYNQVGLIGTAPLSINIPAGTSSFDYVITPRMDVLSEPTETVTVTIREDFGTYDTDPGSLNVAYSVDILDDPPIVSLATSADEVPEVKGETFSFELTRSGGNINQVLQVFIVEGGSARRDVDYTQVGLIGTAPLSLNIPAGQSTYSYTISVREDDISEPIENVTLTVLDEPGTYDVSAGLTGPCAVRIIDAPDLIMYDDFDPRCASQEKADSTSQWLRLGGSWVDTDLSIEWSQCGLLSRFDTQSGRCEPLLQDAKGLSIQELLQLRNAGIIGGGLGFDNWRLANERERRLAPSWAQSPYLVRDL